MLVIKRDGSKTDFNLEKIYNAIKKANTCSNEMTEEDITKALDKINKQIKDTIDVEEIQNIVEDTLMKMKFRQTAKQYILYRDMRTRNRDNRSKLLKDIAKKLNGTNIVNQNANVDEASFGGRKGEASNELMKWFALNNCMSQKSRENHLNNEIYIHDLDSYAVGQHNCLSIPFDHLLAEGFTTRQTDIRPASSINTAFQLIAVIFQLQSLQQFGGVSATHLDWTMVPYVKKSFRKHYLEGLKYLENTEDFNIETDASITDTRYKEHSISYKYALDMTTKELKQAVEGMYHNLNTLQSRSGNQLPFTSINYGTCTSPEGRMVTKALLEGSLEGVGKLHRTPIFPCGIFQYMKGVNDKPGTPNYDLYQLALKSTSKRLYPNYANVDWSNNAGYDKNDPKTYFSTMGALAYQEHLYIKINDKIQDISIGDLFYLCRDNKNIKGRPTQLFYNKKQLSNTVSTWTRFKPLNDLKEFKSESGVYRITYIPEDISYIGSTKNIKQRFRDHLKNIRHCGGLDCGLNFGDTDTSNYQFEVLEYTTDFKEVEKHYILNEPNINFKGISTKYYKNIGLTKARGYSERPNISMNPDIPQEFVDLSNSNIMVLDRDNRWVKIKHIFKNDSHNTPLMMHITYKEYNKNYTLCCTEDHPLWTGKKFVKASELTLNDKLYRGDYLPLDIVEIKYYTKRCDSYDIGTETGSFIGSDIIMHNCRTANGADINAEPGQNPQLKDGRGNICPVTIILPTLAMEAKEMEGDLVENFFKILDIKLKEAKDMLIERFNYICAQSPESAKFMYENNVMYGYKKEEGIRSALKHGTLALGQIGVAETLQILIGKNQTTQEGLELAKRIESLFNTRCKEYKEKYKLNFGVYYSPAENLCYTAMTKFKQKYGIIPNVSDREYFTNSIHVPVWEKVNAFEKIDIESQLTGYSNAGCITYIEADGAIQHNLKALETVINYAMNKDIPYFAINVPNDTCLDCGYTGEFNDECPICHSKHIQQLRRVTGYLTGDYKSAFNKGKQEEVEERVKHI